MTQDEIKKRIEEYSKEQWGDDPAETFERTCCSEDAEFGVSLMQEEVDLTKKNNIDLLNSLRKTKETIESQAKEISQLKEALSKVRGLIFTNDDSVDGESIYPYEIDFGTVKDIIDNLLNYKK